MIIDNIKSTNKEKTLYYAFIIAILLHIFFFYIGIKYPAVLSMPISLQNQLDKKETKPLEFTFVDIPEKEIEFKKLNKDALPSDRDRISAAIAPKHFDPNANKLPEMHGKSKNLVLPSQIQQNQMAPHQNKQETLSNAEHQNELSQLAQKNMNLDNAKTLDRNKLAESLRNLDKYISNAEMRNNPTSSYQPEIPPDSNLWLDTQGVDLGPWARQVHIRVRNNWIIPMAAHLGFKGKVSIDFEVLRNGTIKNLIVSSQSGIMSFDQAALNAIAISNPLPPLPMVYPKPILKGRFTFYYNMEPYEK